MVRSRLRSRTAALALAGMACLLGGCDAHQWSGKPAPLVGDPLYARAEVAKASLKPNWQRSIALNVGEEIRDAWHVGDSIYVTTSSHLIHSINAASGAANWTVDLGPKAIQIFRPVVSAKDKYVYVVSRGRITLVEKASGRVAAETNLGFSATSDPVVITIGSFSRICVGAAGRFHALFVDPLGAQQWNIAAEADYFRPTPVFAAGGLFVASSRGRLWRLDPLRSGFNVWQDRRVNGEVVAGLAADSSRVLVPCLDRQLYSFDSASGSPQWEARLEGVLDQTPVIAGGSVLCVGSGKGLYCINAESGLIRWTLPGIKSVAVALEEKAVTLSEAGEIVTVALETGDIETRIAPTGRAPMKLLPGADAKSWVATASYEVGDLVTFRDENGRRRTYTSLQHANVGHDPSVAAAWWKEVGNPVLYAISPDGRIQAFDRE